MPASGRSHRSRVRALAHIKKLEAAMVTALSPTRGREHALAQRL